MAELTTLFPQAILFLFLIPFFQVSFATSSKPTTGLSMRLIRRDSLFQGNLTKSQRIKTLLQLSNLNESASDMDDIHLPTSRVRETFLYVVETNLGTPGLPVKLIMDTGGNLIWTQCRPCQNCFPQTVPIYDSQASPTYHKLPCSHELCQGDYRRFDCVENECVYDIRYGVVTSPNSPRTKGVASFESFQFTIDDVHGTRVVDDMIFGCSNDNTNFEFSGGQVSGILGLSLAPDSLGSQLAKKGVANYRFSYCLAPFHDETVQHGVLRFGDDIRIPAGNIQTTNFVVTTGRYPYFMELLDISVGFHLMGFQELPDMFLIREDGAAGGCLIDSGFIIGTIDQRTPGRNAYKEVMQVFQAYYESQGLRRIIGKVVENLPLCFRKKRGFKNFLTMTYHFNGGDYVLDGKYVHYFNEEDKYFCVALRPSTRTIIGAWHQQNMRLIYNMNIGALQWVTENCANDHQIP